MALETECDVCHVNYFHKVFILFDCLFVSLFRDHVAAECDDDDDALFLSAVSNDDVLRYGRRSSLCSQNTDQKERVLRVSSVNHHL